LTLTLVRTQPDGESFALIFALTLWWIAAFFLHNAWKLIRQTSWLVWNLIHAVDGVTVTDGWTRISCDNHHRETVQSYEG